MNPILKKFLPHLISLVVFVVIASAMSWPAIQGKNLATHDIEQHKGMSKEVVDHREEFDEEPLWTNGMFGGMPTYQISILYPKNIIKNIDRMFKLGLPHPTGLIFKTLIGFYILLLVLRTPWKFAIGGAIAFALSSYFMIILEAGHNSKANSIAYIAPAIAGIILIYRQRLLLGGAVAALFLSLNLVANHFQVTYYMGLSILIFGIVELVKAIQRKEIGGFIKPTITAIGALLLALTINNTNLRLTKDYLDETQRGTSALNIKAEMAAKKAKQAEEKRQKLIEEAKEKDGEEFNEADFLSGKKAYATNWSYGLGESFTLFVPNFKGGGSSNEGVKETKTYKVVKPYINKALRGRSKKEKYKAANQQTASMLYWGIQPGTNGPVYVGAGIIFLFILALVAVKSHYKWWLLATAVLGLFIAWGKNFLPFFNFMFDYFPFYNGFRAVTIGLILTEFAMPLLGFIFIKELINGELDKDKVFKQFKIVTGLVVLLLFYFLAFATSIFDFEAAKDSEQLAKGLKADRIDLFKGDVLRSLGFVLAIATIVGAIILNKMKPLLASILLAGFLFIDLFGVDTRYLTKNKYQKSDRIENPFDQSPASKLISNDKENYRVFDASKTTSGAMNDASTAYFHKDIGGYSSVKLMIYQDMLDFTLGQDMGSVEQVANQMKKQVGSVQPQYMNSVLKGKNAVNMLNTRYLIFNPNNPPYKNPHAMGNAWLVNNIKHYDSADSVMFSINTTNLKKVALTQSEALKGKSYASKGSIKLTNYKANHLTYDYNGDTESFGVFSEIYYKDWNAYIDGELVDIHKVNYILRGVELPAGKHKVEFKFEPSVYFQGENISLIGCILLFGLLIFAGYKEFKPTTEEAV